MSDITPALRTILDDITNGKDLVVVLKNRYNEAYIENLHLSSIILWDNKFIGKISNVHSCAGLPGIKDNHSVAYAYNSFCPMVSCSSLDALKMRIYSTHAYSEIKFLCRNSYKKVWSSEQATSLKNLYDNYKKGGNLKALISDHDGYTYVVKVQTLRINEQNNNFTAETIYDGIPMLYKEPERLANISKELERKIQDFTPPQYPSGSFLGPLAFFSLAFSISPTSTLQHHIEPTGRTSIRNFPFKTVELWKEVTHE